MQASLDLLSWRLETFGFEQSPAEKSAWDALAWLERTQGRRAVAGPMRPIGPFAVRSDGGRPAPAATRKPRQSERGTPRQAMAGHCHGLGLQVERRTGRKWDESRPGARDGHCHEQVLKASKSRTDAIEELDLQELGMLSLLIERATEHAKLGAPQAELLLEGGAAQQPAAETCERCLAA